MAVIETFAYSLKPADVQWLAPQAPVLLTAEECQRWQRFRVADARDVFLASRFLLRHLLAQRLHCAPAEIDFGRGEHGKPFIIAPESRWQFNLSHSNGCVLLALADGVELGVDLEHCQARVSLAELASRVLAPVELARFRKLSGRPQQDYFFRVWVLKESYLKLQGTGIWQGLNVLTTEVDVPEYPGDEHVRACYLRAPDAFVAALAYRSADAELVRVKQLQVESLQQLPNGE